MSKAKVGFIASTYVEPFGGVQVEYMMSGTPVITPDWGAFTEVNLHGITGYRCRTMQDFIYALKNIDKIEPETCAKWAINNYTMDVIAPRYEQYFEQVLNVHSREGWYTVDDSFRGNLYGLDYSFKMNHRQ